jgi:hypothetical protein
MAYWPEFYQEVPEEDEFCDDDEDGIFDGIFDNGPDDDEIELMEEIEREIERQDEEAGMKTKGRGPFRPAGPEATYLTDRDLEAQGIASRRTLQAWRQRGDGPKYYKIEGCVRYNRAEVEAWLSEHLHVGRIEHQEL